MIKLGQMVSKEKIEYPMQKSGHTILKGVNWVHNDKLGQMVLIGLNWVHNAEIRSNGLERTQLGTQ